MSFVNWGNLTGVKCMKQKCDFHMYKENIYIYKCIQILTQKGEIVIKTGHILVPVQLARKCNNKSRELGSGGQIQIA